MSDRSKEVSHNFSLSDFLLSILFFVAPNALHLRRRMVSRNNYYCVNSFVKHKTIFDTLIGSFKADPRDHVSENFAMTPISAVYIASLDESARRDNHVVNTFNTVKTVKTVKTVNTVSKASTLSERDTFWLNFVSPLERMVTHFLGASATTPISAVYQAEVCETVEAPMSVHDYAFDANEAKDVKSECSVKGAKASKAEAAEANKAVANEDFVASAAVTSPISAVYQAQLNEQVKAGESVMSAIDVEAKAEANKAGANEVFVAAAVTSPISAVYQAQLNEQINPAAQVEVKAEAKEGVQASVAVTSPISAVYQAQLNEQVKAGESVMSAVAVEDKAEANKAGANEGFVAGAAVTSPISAVYQAQLNEQVKAGESVMSSVDVEAKVESNKAVANEDFVAAAVTSPISAVYQAQLNEQVKAGESVMSAVAVEAQSEANKAGANEGFVAAAVTSPISAIYQAQLNEQVKAGESVMSAVAVASDSKACDEQGFASSSEIQGLTLSQKLWLNMVSPTERMVNYAVSPVTTPISAVYQAQVNEQARTNNKLTTFFDNIMDFAVTTPISAVYQAQVNEQVRMAKAASEVASFELKSEDVKKMAPVSNEPEFVKDTQSLWSKIGLMAIHAPMNDADLAAQERDNVNYAKSAPTVKKTSLQDSLWNQLGLMAIHAPMNQADLSAQERRNAAKVEA